MHRPALRDDRALEHSIFQESDAGPHVHAAFDAGAGDDAVADPSAGIAKKDERVMDQNGEIDPVALTASFWSRSSS